jgi:site-specific DNA-methyltransferase (adenine-specific)
VHAYTPGALYGSYQDRGKYFLSGVNDWPRYSTHLTEKPLALLRKLVRSTTQSSDIIIDPYAGSFTTAHACVQLGRSFIGIEIDPHYFDLACRRIEQAYAQPDLFVPHPAPPHQARLFA